MGGGEEEGEVRKAAKGGIRHAGRLLVRRKKRGRVMVEGEWCKYGGSACKKEEKGEGESGVKRMEIEKKIACEEEKRG